MNLIKRIWQFLKLEEPKQEENLERVFRDLLRENLNTVSVDVIHYGDPILSLSPAERKQYLLYFHRLVTESKIIHRLEYLINKQANLTLQNSSKGELDTAGVMKMDGLSTFKDDVERLSNMFIQEGEAEKRRMEALKDPTDALRL